MPDASEYELVLMLDPEIPDETRDRIAAEARQRIQSGGSLKHDTAWGMRKLAYEIRQRTEADYRFFRFQTGGELLDDLDHNLKIADGVLRFRIFKVDPRSPVIVPPSPAPSPAPSRRPDRRGPSAPPAPREAEAAPAEAEAKAADAETAPADAEAPAPEPQAAPEPEVTPEPEGAPEPEAAPQPEGAPEEPEAPEAPGADEPTDT